MTRFWVLVVPAVVALASCRVAHGEPVDVTVDQPFVLEGGQEATITGANLRLRFTQVLEDSRCPTLVECFWTGQARITVVAESDGLEPTIVEFNTNPAPGLTVDTAAVAGYTITLHSLDPYPHNADDAYALEDYRATLMVRRR